MNKIVVLKFGGTTLGTDQTILKTVEAATTLIDGTLRRGDFVIPVFSALKRVRRGSDPGFSITDILLGYRKHILQEDTLDKGIRRFKEMLAEPHFQLIESLGMGADISLHHQIRDLIESATNKASNFAQGPVSPGHNDLLAHYGELFAVTILSHYLNKRNREGRFPMPTQPVSGGELGILTDDRYGSANILENSCRPIVRNVGSFRRRSLLPIVTGFNGVARVPEGDREAVYVTTLGRSGSDLTATFIGCALHRAIHGSEVDPRAKDAWEAVEVCLVKEAPGVLTANPAIVGDEARPIPYLPYSLAIEAGNIQSKSIQPAQRAEMEVKLFNPSSPQHATVVGPRELPEGLYLVADPAECLYTQVQTIPNYPGALASFLSHFTALNINIAEIKHERSLTALIIDQGLDRAADLQTRLREAGYTVETTPAVLIRLIGNVTPRHMHEFNAFIEPFEPLKYAEWEKGTRALTCTLARGGPDPTRVVQELHRRFILS